MKRSKVKGYTIKMIHRTASVYLLNMIQLAATVFPPLLLLSVQNRNSRRNNPRPPASLYNQLLPE